MLVERRRWTLKLGLAGFAMGAVLVSSAMWAENAAPGARAVRLSNVDGKVRISQGNQLLADQAVENTPLFEGSRVATGDDGKAEIQFEDGSVARLSPNSSLTMKVLRGQAGSGEADVVLDGGLGYFELQGAGQTGAIRVRFGDSTVTASGFTVLRINLDNPPGELAVFSGNAHLERGNVLTLDLHGGESVALNGTDASRYNLAESIEPDSWDTWNSDRDQVLTSEAAARTGATNSFGDNGNPAWNDLDANGNWYDVPGQGYIWSPYEAADAAWDPYGNGYWMWTPRFSYIWVSGYPWGYMPFQCGNWNWYDTFGWGWAPGLNGCQFWWGMGFYGGPYIGSRFAGYRPPLRPRVPHPSIGGGNRAVYPVVAVNRRFPSGVSALPTRDRMSVVAIGGYSVQALHPLSPRPLYGRPGAEYGNRTTYTGMGPAGGGARAGGSGPSGSRAGSSTAAKSTGGSQPAAKASNGASGGSSSASRPSSGGGGGGGHPSGGGGGGGGGHH